ncbi:MAG: hypothetical protein D6729_16745 [Deltaproteobacteria bacterium]|nr:MAG: hypothetical protein D6729_16745 [Deltaproteobacteria bacterium]
MGDAGCGAARALGCYGLAACLLLYLGACEAAVSAPTPPVADAGPDRVTSVEEPVRLGTPLSPGLRAEWTMVSATGGYHFLDGVDVAEPEVTFHVPGTYVLSLVVFRGPEKSAPDYVSVRVNPCAAGQARPCYGGPAGTVDVGMCRAGLRTCYPDGTYGPCEGEVRPQPEQCGDEIDQDCDGTPDALDPDCAGNCPDPPQRTVVCGQGACERSQVIECQGGVWGSCEPGPRTEAAGRDLCDGVDGDCDGSTDEDATTYSWYPDLDRDGAGNPAAVPIEACAPPSPAYSRFPNDCDDSDKDVGPGTPCNDGQTCTIADWCSPAGACVGIPRQCDGCGSDCAACPSGGCCEASCSGDCGTCPAGCRCAFDCQDGCQLTCEQGARCGLRAANTSSGSTLTCAAGAVCDLDCDSVDASCRLVCERGADCSLGCTGVDGCRLPCPAGRGCRLFCGNDVETCILDCGGVAPFDCGNGWRVCDPSECP